MTCPTAIRISWSRQCDAPIIPWFRCTEPELAFALVLRVDAFIVLMNNELNNETEKAITCLSPAGRYRETSRTFLSVLSSRVRRVHQQRPRPGSVIVHRLDA